MNDVRRHGTPRDLFTLIGIVAATALAAACSSASGTTTQSGGVSPGLPGATTTGSTAEPTLSDGAISTPLPAESMSTATGVATGAATGVSGGTPVQGSAVGGTATGATFVSVGAAGASAGALPPVVADPADEPSTDNEGDTYDGVGINPFVMTAHDPFSTFAVDVDTASYDIFRRDALAGVLPIADSVRLEEYVNFFDYDYPAPAEDAEEPFAISLAAAPNLIDNGTTVLRVGLQGKLPPPFEKKQSNLVFLIDRSGSMDSPEKLPLVKEVLTRTLGILDVEDTVSIVAYASGTGVVLPPTPVSEAETIATKIEDLTASGSTNGAGGIQLAYEQAEAAFIEGGINHVVLCTDGDFNVGVSTTQGLVDLITEKRRTGITLTVLGFGTGNLNDAMMEGISNAGNGQYGVIANSALAEEYVEERMLSTLVLIAQDVKIQVEFNSEHVLAYRLLGYENRDIADVDFRNDVVDAGEIGAGHRVTALYELVLAEGTVPEAEGAPEIDDGDPVEGEREVAAEDLVRVKLRYKDVGATEEDAAYEVSRSLTPSDIAASHEDLDADFQWAIAVAAFAEILKGSPYVSSGLLTTIDGIVSGQATRDDDRAEFVELFGAIRSQIP